MTMKTVKDFQDFFKDKNPDLPVYIWDGEMKPMYSIGQLEHAPADPTGQSNEDSIPLPELILLTLDSSEWAGKGVSEYYEKDEEIV